MTLRLSESSFRLPAHVETGLYRIFLDFVADARRAAQTEDIEVEVSLRTQAPDARMVLRQSGTTRLTESSCPLIFRRPWGPSSRSPIRRRAPRSPST